MTRSNSCFLPFSTELGGSKAISDFGTLEVVSGGVGGADRSDDASVIVGFFGSADIGRSALEVGATRRLVWLSGLVSETEERMMEIL